MSVLTAPLLHKHYPLQNMSAVPATNSRAAACVTKYHGKSLSVGINRDPALRTTVRKLPGLQLLAAPRRMATPGGLCFPFHRLVEGHELGHGMPYVAAATARLVAGTAEVKVCVRTVALFARPTICCCLLQYILSSGRILARNTYDRTSLGSSASGIGCSLLLRWRTGILWRGLRRVLPT